MAAPETRRGESAQAEDTLREAERVAAEAKRHKAVRYANAGNGQQHASPRSILREGAIVAMLIALLMGLFRWYLWKMHPDNYLLTPEKLSHYDGVRSKRLYLSILGSVFDVTKGAQHYGPAGSYHNATARDASKAFVTGEFSKQPIDDLTGIRDKDVGSVYRWRSFFQKHKVYRPVGRLIGRYYTATGEKTSELLRVERLGEEAEAKAATTAAPDAESSCNVQYSARDGKTVWCSEGKGYPRHVHDTTNMDRCICVPTQMQNTMLQVYKGCAPDATKCQTQPEEG